MVEYILEYILEILKFYIIFKYFVQARQRKGWIKYVVGVCLLLGFVLYRVNVSAYTFFVYILFIDLVLLCFFKDKVWKIFLIGFWMMNVVGVMDELSTALIEAFLVVLGISVGGEIVSLLGYLVTIMVLLLILTVINKSTNYQGIHIGIKYYVFFSVLGFVDSFILSNITSALNTKNIVDIWILIFASCCMYIQMGMVLVLAVSRDGYRQKDELNKKYLKMQEQQYLYLKEINEDTRKFRHDMKAHIRSLNNLYETGHYEDIKEYLEQISTELHVGKRITVNNGIVDAIINQSLYEAEKHRIDLKIKGQLFEDCNIEPYDLCVIFSNMLNNAIEAAMKTEKRSVLLKIKRTERLLEIHMENDYVGERKIKGETFLSTKEDVKNHGIGLRNIQKSLEKYAGKMQLTALEDRFYTSIEIKL